MIFAISVLFTGLAVLDAYSLALASFVFGFWLYVFWRPKDKTVALTLAFVNSVLVITTLAAALLILRGDPGRVVALMVYIALLTLPTYVYWNRDDDSVHA